MEIPNRYTVSTENVQPLRIVRINRLTTPLRIIRLKELDADQLKEADVMNQILECLVAESVRFIFYIFYYLF
jgi:hypothetical protein